MSGLDMSDAGRLDKRELEIIDLGIADIDIGELEVAKFTMDFGRDLPGVADVFFWGFRRADFVIAETSTDSFDGPGVGKTVSATRLEPRVQFIDVLTGTSMAFD